MRISPLASTFTPTTASVRNGVAGRPVVCAADERVPSSDAERQIALPGRPKPGDPVSTAGVEIAVAGDVQAGYITVRVRPRDARQGMYVRAEAGVDSPKRSGEQRARFQ